MLQPQVKLQLTHMTSRLRTGRREASKASLRAFAQLYFEEQLRKPNSKLHEDLYGSLESLEKGARLAIAAPRNSAKSTVVSLIYVLWCICHARARFIVLISDTAEKACEFLDHIKYELVENALLVEDYPEVCEKGGRYPLMRWRADEISTFNKIKVSALGYGQNIRGKRNRDARPDLIILDDVESPENTNTPESRKKLSDWFYKSILKAGNLDTRVLVVGTIQHYDSLLAKLTDTVKNPFWQGRVYRSVISWATHQDLWQSWSEILHKHQDHKGATGPEAAERFFQSHKKQMLKGTKVLWPEEEDYHRLMLMREAEGRASFDSEKQNEPVNPQDCFFLEEDFRFWDDHWATEKDLIASIGTTLLYYGACDPSLGKQGRHADDSAIITIVRDTKSGAMFVLDADIARRKPDRIIDDVVEYGRMRKYTQFGFEANQFQSFLADEIQRRSQQAGVYLNIEKITHTTDKIGRIQSLQPLIRSGTLQLCRRHQALIEQLRLFPKASHDDGPDTLEMACMIAKRGHRPLRVEDFHFVGPRVSFLPPGYKFGDFSRSLSEGGWW